MYKRKKWEEEKSIIVNGIKSPIQANIKHRHHTDLKFVVNVNDMAVLKVGWWQWWDGHLYPRPDVIFACLDNATFYLCHLTPLFLGASLRIVRYDLEQDDMYGMEMELVTCGPQMKGRGRKAQRWSEKWSWSQQIRISIDWLPAYTTDTWSKVSSISLSVNGFFNNSLKKLECTFNFTRDLVQRQT